jgi:hypothetical protein
VSDDVRVPTGLHLQSRFFAATAGAWRALARLESAAVRELTDPITIDRPLYVTSLPRSGTTIIVEMLEQHPELTAHHYSDFPNVWTPYWRNYLLQRTRRERPRSVERAHRDRIEVSNDSPEAVEEVLWMHFFTGRHDPGISQILDGGQRNADFDAFYRDHIRKLLAVRGARRYLAKGNYNLARIRYLLALFPDAKFLVPVRDPAPHIGSLMKQHALFTRSSGTDRRIPLQLALSGHYEFGPGRRVVNYGDDDVVRAIQTAWADGREAEGWARYWAGTYGHLLGQIEADAAVAQAVLLFRYEDLCTDSRTVIDRILAHGELDPAPFAAVRSRYAEKLALPDYYQAEFQDSERAAIEHHCAPVHARLLARCQLQKSV